MTDQPNSSPESLPSDLYGHLKDMNPKSFEFGRELGALNELAMETGHRLLGLEDIFPPISLSPAEGYTSELIVPKAADIPVSQFEGVIHSLHTPEKSLQLDVNRMVTDSGKQINLCDLRPFMTSSIREGEPKQEKQRDQLDRVVRRDLKFLAELGHPRNRVKKVPKVGYTRMGDGLVRAYWMPVLDTNAPETLTVARLADSTTIPGEEQIYRVLLKEHLSK